MASEILIVDDEADIRDLVAGILEDEGFVTRTERLPVDELVLLDIDAERLAIVGRVLEDHGGRIELKDAADFREGQRGAWMRMRFAISGAPAKADGAEAATRPEIGETATPSVKDPETKQVAVETKEPTEKTNDSTKIEASTGS